MPVTTCHFSVIQYVPDPVRDEPRNVGVVVLAPEVQFGAVRVLLARTGLKTSTTRYRAIKRAFQTYRLHVRDVSRPALFEDAPVAWEPADLMRMHEESTNLIRFTRPGVANATPQTLLVELFGRRVARHTQPRATRFSSAVVTRVFERTFESIGHPEWVHEDIEVATDTGHFQFDIGVANGQLYGAVETVSFKIKDVQRAEETAAWFAHVWPGVQRETGATGYLIAERPDLESVVMERFDRAAEWAVASGIQVAMPSEVEAVARELATNAS